MHELFIHEHLAFSSLNKNIVAKSVDSYVHLSQSPFLFVSSSLVAEFRGIKGMVGGKKIGQARILSPSPPLGVCFSYRQAATETRRDRQQVTVGCVGLGRELCVLFCLSDSGFVCKC